MHFLFPLLFEAELPPIWDSSALILPFRARPRGDGKIAQSERVFHPGCACPSRR